MSLLTPAALALSALTIPVVAMYMLKLRRRTVVVPSTLLWRRALVDQQANAPWQRLRSSILLILQLLAVLLLVFTLAAPAYSSTLSFRGDEIIIVDQSYWMQAQDIQPSRFEAAIAQARSIAARIPSGSVVSVIGMGAEPVVAADQATTSSSVDTALDSLRPTLQSPNFTAALSLAESLARNGEPTRVVLVTSRESGIATPSPLAVAKLPFQLEIDRIGGTLRDLGLVVFNSSRSGGHVDAVAQVLNYGTVPAASNLDLYVNGALADVRPVAVRPGKRETFSWNALPLTARTLRVTLGNADDLKADNSAWSEVSALAIRRVLLVGPPDYFLKTALGLNSTVQLSTISPAGYTPKLADRYDAVVFDGYLPQTLPNAGLIISPPAGTVGDLSFGSNRHGGGVQAEPGLPSTLSDLMQYVDLSDVHVLRDATFQGPSWLQPIAVAGSTPIILAGEEASRRLVVVPFNLSDSDWPLRISFPIMMQNLLHFLSPGLDLASANLSPGDPVILSPPTGTTSIEVRAPGGGTQTLRPPFPPFARTQSPGLYSAMTSGGFRSSSSSFVVNFFPSLSRQSGARTIVLGKARGEGTTTQTIPTSLAWVLILFVFGVLSAEWWASFRR